MTVKPTFYLDTEFNGHRGGLISLALVPLEEERAYFYQAQELRADKKCRDLVSNVLVPYESWVNLNVAPHLHIEPLPPHMFRRRLRRFVSELDGFHLVADHPIDVFYFIDALQEDLYGDSHYCTFTSQIIDPSGVDYDTYPQPVSLIPHNALEDAKALRLWHLKVSPFLLPVSDFSPKPIMGPVADPHVKDNRDRTYGLGAERATYDDTGRMVKNNLGPLAAPTYRITSPELEKAVSLLEQIASILVRMERP